MQLFGLMNVCLDNTRATLRHQLGVVRYSVMPLRYCRWYAGRALVGPPSTPTNPSLRRHAPQVRLWPAWKCVWYVEGPSLPGTLTSPLGPLPHPGAPLARFGVHASTPSPAHIQAPQFTLRWAFDPPGSDLVRSLPVTPTPPPPPRDPA